MYEEPQENNDLFFTCSLIEYIARKTKNTKKHIISIVGKQNITKIYTLASIYHTENINKIADEFINKSNIKNGNYDITSTCTYKIPTYFEIGKVYKRLIIMVNSNKEKYVDTLITVLSSWIIEKIDNYNSSMYSENPNYIKECYKAGKII